MWVLIIPFKRELIVKESLCHQTPENTTYIQIGYKIFTYFENSSFRRFQIERATILHLSENMYRLLRNTQKIIKVLLIFFLQIDYSVHSYKEMTSKKKTSNIDIRHIFCWLRLSKILNVAYSSWFLIKCHAEMLSFESWDISNTSVYFQVKINLLKSNFSNCHLLFTISMWWPYHSKKYPIKYFFLW